MSDRDTLSRWLQKRTPQWQALDALIEAQRQDKRSSPQDIRELIEGYRSLGHDCALAENVARGSKLPQVLTSLRERAHELIFRPATRPARALLGIYRDAVPAAWREVRTPGWIATALFLLATLAGWLLVAAYPELAGLFLDPRTISGVQQGELWTDGLLKVTPSSLLSLGIMTNNIMVTFSAVALGLLFGLGTLYIIGLNGFMLGAVFAFTGAHGLGGRLFEFVIAHGCVELSVIVLAAAGGLRLGQALAQPGDLGRRHSFEQAVRTNIHLLALFVPVLVVCGLIEGYVSPDPDFSMAVRVLLGVGWWLIFMLLLTGRMPGLHNMNGKAKGRFKPGGA